MNDGYGVRVPSTGKPKFIMVGIDKPDGSVRLYASRELPRDVGWGQREVNYTTAWHIDATMSNVLIIDKPTWGEAFARAFEIWANWDRNAEIENKQAPKGTLPAQKVVTPGSDEYTVEESRRRHQIAGRVLDGPAHPEAER